MCNNNENNLIIMSNENINEIIIYYSIMQCVM